MLTDRDIAVLMVLATFHVLSRQQIQRLCFPTDSSSRITRRRLQMLVEAQLINRHPFSVFKMESGTPGAAYYPSRKGCEFLAQYTGDERYLAVSTRTPPTHLLFHFIEVSETHITIEAAIAQQAAVKLEGWINEWDESSPDAESPEQRYRLFTLLNDRPRLVVAPDSAFMLSLAGISKIFYLEQDRDQTGVRRIAATKTPGYAALAERKLHRRHFPTATVDTFSVLMIAPDERRRDALRKAIAGKPGADLWKFAAATDVKPKTFLHADIWLTCQEGPVSLVKTPQSQQEGSEPR